MRRNDSGSARPSRRRASAAAWLAVGALLLAPPASSEKRLDTDRLETSYIAVLDLLAKGHRDQALQALMATETEALGSAPTASRIDRVWRHKLAVVRKALELTTPEVLVPVIVLHHDAYELYREAKQPVLARHSRDMAADLAAFRAQSTKSEADRQFAGWVLASLGASVLDLRTSGTSATILEDALALSPRNPAALLGLAWAHEIHGEYQEAAERLAALLEVEPDHAHARLRLAVCERRLGNLETARGLLHDLLEMPAEPWIRSVAYQELARTLLGLGQLEAAERVARKALEELPGEQEIAIFLASICERRGRLAEAESIIEGIQPAAAGEVSARYVYDGRPDLGIEQARAKMRAMMDERLGVLASGLRWWGAGAAQAQGVAAGGEG